MKCEIKRVPSAKEIFIAEAGTSQGQSIQSVHTFLDYVRLDWESNPARLILEWIGMSMAISASLILSISISEPPLFQILITWIISSSILLTCALSRGSTGMVIFNSLLIIIDVAGLSRLGL